jgi:capsular polysaccharide transport system permease protein
VTSTSLKKSFIIQLRVIGALIMREILTRYGRHNLGFIWLFLEPILFTFGIVIMWSFTKLHAGSVSVIAFAITGYSSVLMYRNVTGRMSHAIEPNLSLMYHRNVKVIDLFLSRYILEVAGISISFVFISLMCILVDLIQPPSDILLMIEAWLLLALFALGLGLVIGVISEVSEVFERIWHTFQYLFFPFSGAGYLVDTLPTHLQKYALYIPTVHATEMLRHGYYGSVIRTYEEPYYLFVVSVVLIFIGLLGLKIIASRVESE